MKRQKKDRELDLIEQFEENEKKLRPVLRSDDDDADRRQFDCGVFPVSFCDDFTDKQAIDFCRKQEETQTRKRAKRAKRVALHHAVYAIRYCTACGELIVRTTESPEIWCKIRRCAKCLKHGQQSTRERKFCSSCGKDFSLELAHAHDWRTKAVCSSCADLNKLKSKAVKVLP